MNFLEKIMVYLILMSALLGVRGFATTEVDSNSNNCYSVKSLKFRCEDRAGYTTTMRDCWFNDSDCIRYRENFVPKYIEPYISSFVTVDEKLTVSITDSLGSSESKAAYAICNSFENKYLMKKNQPTICLDYTMNVVTKIIWK